MNRIVSLAAAAFALLLAAGSSRAEVSEVRFARQLGFGYLQLYVMQEQGLVEKQAAARGLKVTAKYAPIGTPAAINDALLWGAADFGSAGVTPFLTLWDKTRSNVAVKAVAALNAQPAFLNTVNPAVRGLKDFTEKDRIALPTVKLSLQAILLQMAAEQTFGAGQQFKLDPLTVTLSHPDGTAALLAGRTEITAHFTSPPFQYQQLEDAKIHRVLSSYEITGGPASFSAIWSTSASAMPIPRFSRRSSPPLRKQRTSSTPIAPRPPASTSRSTIRSCRRPMSKSCWPTRISSSRWRRRT